jgi:signal transduction histidine kinase
MKLSTAQDKLNTLAAEFDRLSEQGVRSAPEMGLLVAELQDEIDQWERERQDLRSLYQVAGELTATVDLAELLESIIDRAIVLVGAERGRVVLAREAGGFDVVAARRFDAGALGQADGALSNSLIERVLADREPILTTNVQTDERFELSQSILIQDIRSVIAVPLVSRGELEGAIYVDTRMSARHFGQADLNLLTAMASQAATAIRSAKLYDAAQRSNKELQTALNELQETQQQLVQAERLAAVGRLAASVAHELRSPLMVMRNSIYYLDRLVERGKIESPELFRRYFAKLDAEIDRQSKIINDLLFFSRNRPRKLAQIDLVPILQETLMRVPMPESIEVHTALDADLDMVTADADQLQQVFVNLVTNAVQAMPNGGTLTLTATRDEFYALVQVSDTGVGISPANLERLFQPFFTTKDKGIGLGLAVTKSIIEGHRGTIELASVEGEGTTFSVHLPFELVG